jgi:branched-chain amino acid transport system ATP-binding protein
VLENGVIVGHGTSDQLKSDPAVQRAYLGGVLPAAKSSS